MAIQQNSLKYFGGQNSGPVEVDDVHDLIVKKDGVTHTTYDPLAGSDTDLNLTELAFTRPKDLPTSITAFRTGDVIPVDGPQGTAKMGKDSLLAITSGTQNVCGFSTVDAVPNIDTSTKTLDLGGAFLLRTKHYDVFITDRSIPIIDLSITSRLQMLVYNFETSSFSLKIFTYAPLLSSECIVGIIAYDNNQDFNFRCAWFPFEFTVDGKSSEKYQLSLDGRLSAIEGLFYDDDSNAVETKNGYIRYVDGKFVANNVMHCAVFSNVGYGKVEVCTGASDGIAATVSFFTDVLGSCYLRDESAQAITGKNKKYSVAVPRDAKVIAVSYRLDAIHTTNFYIKLTKEFEPYNGLNSSGFAISKKDVDDFGWYIPQNLPNFIFSEAILASEQMTIEAKLIAATTHQFAITCFNENGSQLYTSGWKTELKFTTPINCYKYVIWYRKQDQTNFNSGDEEHVTEDFEYVRMTAYNAIGRPASMEYVDDSVSNLDPKIMKNVAHQGFSTTTRYFGDSRLSSYVGAAKYGFDYGECDVQFSSDGVPVCCHDASFVSGGNTIVIADHTYAELITYDYYGETIASLDDVVKCCKENGIGLYLDKTWAHLGDATKRAALFGIVKKYAMEDNVVWAIEPNSTILGYIQSFYANSSISVVSYHALTQTIIDFANAAKNDTNKVVISQNYNDMSVQDVIDSNALLNSGVTIEVWAIDDIPTYKSYAPYVSAIISNKLSRKIVRRLENQ